MNDSHLLVRGLSKRYDKKLVVKNVSLDVKPGEIVGLLGPNGAGKTTSFYMIVGLTKSASGQILLGSKDLTRAPMHTRARAGISYLPQEPSVFRKLSVWDNVMAILELRHDLTVKARDEKAKNLLEELQISHLKDSLGLSLSGGERRRVEIARALAIEPRFILLDEPFAGVDPISVIDIKRIIQHLAERGIGVLITDHNVRETLAICEHAYIVNNGEIFAAGTPDEILAHQGVRDVYLGQEFVL